ncbi:ORF40s (chloroplast), partial [Olea europaea subsp. europaea]
VQSLLFLREKKFMTHGPSTSTRHCSFRLSPIAKNFPQLPLVGVWAMSQSQCG